jgi:hypothetical protein
VAGPLVVVIALVVGVAGIIFNLTASDSATSAGPRVEVGHVNGTGGGIDLQPPTLVKSRVFSLSARVLGSPTVRRGPGTQYAPVMQVNDGQEFHVVACSPDCEWLRILSLTDPGQWWLPSSFLSVSGNVHELPVLTPVDNYGR